MSDTISTAGTVVAEGSIAAEGTVSAGVGTLSTEATAIAGAVEGVLAKERSAAPAVTPAEFTPQNVKEGIAHGIYTAWRNNCLGSLPAPAFQLVEHTSPELIAAIAAALT